MYNYDYVLPKWEEKEFFGGGVEHFVTHTTSKPAYPRSCRFGHP
jgi:hypothetical protein